MVLRGKGMTIGEQIRLMREKRGYSQKDLAAVLKVTPAFLSRIERDRSRPGYGLVLVICKILDYSIMFVPAEDIVQRKVFVVEDQGPEYGSVADNLE